MNITVKLNRMYLGTLLMYYLKSVQNMSIYKRRGSGWQTKSIENLLILLLLFFSVAFLALAFFALALNSNPPELTLVTDLLVPPGKSTIIIISYFYSL